MKQVDVIPWTQVALDLPEADLLLGAVSVLGMVDAVRLARRLEHVPELVGKEGAAAVGQKLRRNFFLVSITLPWRDQNGRPPAG
jgi:hypothetical protein